jgi:L-ascorbate metabolism protein UlaG (beta-lactamase superfamily)
MYKKTLATILILIILILGGIYFFKIQNNSSHEEIKNMRIATTLPIITPISHATMILDWNSKIIYTDPVGSEQDFAGKPSPDLILITDIHSDHLSTTTLANITKPETIIIAPEAVAEVLSKELSPNFIILKNTESTNQLGFNILAVPMYNIPESETAFHTKGRGNGYTIEFDGKKVYIAGDTSKTPEMSSLQNIDIAFLPMNLPYTMSVEEAAQAALAFKPKIVTPYHYRGPNGLSDINKFKELVNAGNPSIQVNLMNFYPQAN